MCSSSSLFSQAKNEDDLKKQANSYFEEEDYGNAYKFYSQLVSLYPKDAEYNYRLGVCMLYTEPDKKKPFSYLKLAIKNPADAPKDALFYLGKTYHVNYQFDEAIKYYNEFKKTGSSNSIKKLQVDREIEACKNGKRLLSNLSDLVIISKKQLNEADYFRSYDVKSIGGKLLVKPDDFKSNVDKKKKEKSVVYVPKSGERVYYSSYGENANRGRDLFYVNKLPNGSWSKPIALPTSINTEFDEDYPFLHPNGKTLYFSSKGHNSMGGYDVFKTTYNDETNSWSTPVNLEFPINSPDDDILFVTDSLEKTAFFSTGRYSPFGKIDVLKINTERRPMNMAVIKGTVLKESAEQSLKSKITVKNIANGEIVGTYQAQENGDYYLEIPNGGKFLFTVETPGLPIQSDAVQVPVAYSLKPYKQAITYESKKLKIINYFDGSKTDEESYAMMLDLIEKKAKLEINESEPYNNGLKDALKNQNPTTDLNSVSTTNPSVVSENKNNQVNTNKNVTNEQLINIAKEDAKEAQLEATKLKQEATDAFGLATQKTAEAIELQKQAEKATTNANSLKEEAKTAQNIANLATNLAKKLEVDAQSKQKEADLTNQYITQLEAVTKNKNNKEALTKLEQIQKELDDLANQKNQSDDLFASIKAENELKQNELTKSEKKNTEILNEIKQLNTEVTELENDLANESDKSLKENINAQIRELKNELDTKNKDLTTNTEKINNLNNELVALNEELIAAGKILKENTDDIASKNPTKNNNVVAYNDTETTPNVTANTSNKTNETTTNTNNVSTNSDNNINTAKNNNSQTNNNQAEINNNPNNNNDVKTDINSIIDNSIVISKPLSLDILTGKYDEKINYDAIRDENKTELLIQNQLLNEYNKEVTNLINIDKKELSSTKDSELKKKLNQEIKSLEKLKTDNSNVIALNTKKIKEIEANPLAFNQTENNQNKSDVNTSQTNTTESTNSNSNITSNNFVNENQTPIVNPISVSNDNVTMVKNLNLVKTSLNQTNSDLASIIADNNNVNTSPELKQSYNSKFNELKQQQNVVNELIAKTEANINNNINSQDLENKAEKLNNDAFELRKQSANKSGTEKETLIAQAKQIETEALNLKTEAANINEKQNNITYETNKTNLTELQKLSATKASNEISQANLLADEATLNFKQAQKLREEANAYPNGAAKLGGLSNADEKEKEAIEKQNKAIALLAPLNPNYKLKTIENKSDVTQDINALNSAITKSNQLQAETSLALSNSNQSQINNLSATLAQSNADNTQISELKTQATNLNSEAKNLIVQAQTKNNGAEKASLLLEANKKEKETITKLSEANSMANTTVASKTTEPEATNNTAAKTNSNEVNNNNTAAETNDTNQTDIVSNKTNENSSVKNNSIEKTNNTTQNDAVTNNENQSTKNSIDNSGITAQITNLKNDVNNPTPALVLNFNTYNSSDAVGIKNQASEKLNSAINTDKLLEASLDKLAQQSSSQSSQTGTTINQTSISNTLNEADELNTEAMNYRKSSATKTGQEKENDLAKARELETKAIAKKIEAANKQKQLNQAIVEANATSLAELEKMAQGKNISELSSADMYTNDANAFLKQSKNIRLEADAYPSDAAKLGGYSNAEEKEQQAIAKQEALLAIYKKYFSNYVPKKPVVSESSPELTNKLNDIKSLVEKNYQTHIDGLQLLSQANDKEYKSRFLTLPENLNQTQQTNKTTAQTNFKKSQELNTQANQTNDLKQKKGLLIEANTLAQKAITSLNEINNTSALATNNAKTNTQNNTTPNNATTATNNNNNLATNNNSNTNKTNNQTNNATTSSVNNTNTVKLKVEGLEVKNTNVYTPANPIPIDPKLPEGLIFKVQIGAFKAPLPDNTFKGLSPIIAQNTPSGYIRYMAGNFEKYESANAVKNDLRNLGYSDAFVVVYFNGQRISISEAMAKLQANGQKVEMATNTSAGLTTNANVPRNPFPTNTQAVVSNQQTVVVSNELEKINGLLYTVQIGVFSKQVTKAQLFNLSPIYTEQLPSGLYRYTAGIYNQKDRLLNDKKKVVDLGVKDAFVSAYYNSKKTTFAEAEKLQAENSNLKLETQNPIIFPNASAINTTNSSESTATTNTNNNQTAPQTPQVAAFTNGVTSGPAPTANNGVKYDEAGITFKVQIGAYKNQVPNDVAAKFLSIKTWPVSNVVINGLFIYTIGSFNGLSFAKQLKDEAISIGINDAFITVYKDGKKLYGAEATQYLNQ